MNRWLSLLLISGLAAAQVSEGPLPWSQGDDPDLVRVWLEAERCDDSTLWQGLWERSAGDTERERILRSVGRVGSSALAGWLESLLSHAEWGSSSALAPALGFAVSQTPSETLLALAAEKWGGTALARVVGAQGRLPAPGPLRDRISRKILAELDQGTPEAQAAIYTAIPRVANLDVRDYARRHVAASDPKLRRAALFWAGRAESPPDDSLIQAILPSLVDENEEIAWMAVRCLGRVSAGKDEAGVLLVSCAMDDQREGVQVEALRALGRLHSPLARAAILSRIRSADPQVRREAFECAEAVARSLVPADRRGLSALAIVALEEELVVDVKRAALLAAAALEPDWFLRHRSRFRMVDPWPLRVAALRASKQLPRETAWSDLRRAATTDPDRRVRAGGLEVATEWPELLQGLSLSDLHAAEVVQETTSGRYELAVHGEDPGLVMARANLLAAWWKANPEAKLAEARNTLGWESTVASPVLQDAEPAMAVIDLLVAVGQAPLASTYESHPRRPIASHARSKVGSKTPSGVAPNRASLDRFRLVGPRLGNLPTTAVIETSRGALRVELFAKEAPITVDNFVFLGRSGFFDGLLFHRVVPNFVAQAGCPRGDGSGEPPALPLGLSHLPCELSERPYERGSLGMALTGKDTGGSQWFFCHTAAPHLDGRYTQFGRLIEGFEILDRLVPGDTILGVSFSGGQ